SSCRTPYWTALNHLPDCAGGAPWVRWPPAARLRPMIVSPGFRSAIMTAPFACAPECGWTLAKPQLNSFFARSMANVSTASEGAALVVAAAGIAFRIFVGEDGALCLQNRLADD